MSAKPNMAASRLGSRLLPSFEWLADVAYIPPGAHRWLTAAGLTAGLWGGRSFMDIITARRHSDGKPLKREDVPQVFRAFYGKMRYNPYSDNASDRWKAAVDGLTPVALGGVGAYLGSGHYFYGSEWRLPGSKAPEKAWSGINRTVRTQYESGQVPLDVADHMSGFQQSETLNKPAAGSFIWASDTGFHLPGGWWPFGTGMSAKRFEEGAGKRVFVPFMPWFNRWLGNRSQGSSSLYGAMRETVKWMEGNLMVQSHPEKWLNEKDLMKRVKNGVQVFRKVTPQQEKNLAAEFHKLVNAAHDLKLQLAASGKSQEEISNRVNKFLCGDNKLGIGMFGIDYERMLMRAGFDLREVVLGDYGPFSFFTRLIGGAKAEREVAARYAKHLQKDLGISLGMKPAEWAAKQSEISKKASTTAYASGGAMLATGLVAGGYAADRTNKKMDHAGVVKDAETDEHRKSRNGSGIVGWVNGAPLDVMHWASRLTISPPSMHRLMNATYLTATLLGGMKVADALTGRKLQLLKSGPLANSALAKKDVWAILRPIYGKLAYTPGSSLPADRWRQVAHYLIPVGVGVFGTYMGSYLYFRDHIKHLAKPDALEDYADRISLEQSKPFAWAMAVTSIFNTGSGIHLVPFFSYSSNLQNRYLMASGHQVALPGLGKWWSGNPGLHPWGVKRTLDHISNYMTYNPDPNPHELPSLVHSVIGKLYPALPEAELLKAKTAMLGEITQARNRYIKGGQVPAEQQEELKKVMQSMTHGVGFEQLLMTSGLNPAEANLSSNGVSGKLGNWAGAGGEVSKLQREYRGKFAERVTKPRANGFMPASRQQQRPATTAPAAPSIGPGTRVRQVALNEKGQAARTAIGA